METDRLFWPWVLGADRSLLLILALLLVATGCKEMGEVFQPVEEFQDTRQKEEEERLAAEQVEAQRVQRLEDEFRAAARRGDGPDFGPEPDKRADKVRWLVQHRLACNDQACSEAHLKRFAEFGPELGNDLIALVYDPELKLGVEAVRLVGLLDIKASASALTDLLLHDKSAIRLAAIRALTWLKVDSTAMALAARLPRAPTGAERSALVQALASLGGPNVVKTLGTAALSRELDQAHAAIAGLAKMKSKAAVAKLDAVVNLAEGASTKRHALEALAGIGTPAARKALTDATRSRDPQVKAWAREILKKK